MKNIQKCWYRKTICKYDEHSISSNCNTQTEIYTVTYCIFLQTYDTQQCHVAVLDCKDHIVFAVLCKYCTSLLKFFAKSFFCNQKKKKKWHHSGKDCQKNEWGPLAALIIIPALSFSPNPCKFMFVNISWQYFHWALLCSYVKKKIIVLRDHFAPNISTSTKIENNLKAVHPTCNKYILEWNHEY